VRASGPGRGGCSRGRHDSDWRAPCCSASAFFLLPRQLLAIFGMTEPAVVELGVQLLRMLSVSGLFVVVALAYTGGLQGTGDTRSPMYISIVSQIVIPLGYCFVLQQLDMLDPFDIWLAILAGHVTRCVLTVIRFNQGKWRTITVNGVG
jgi:Na+-driven multidrug efflux pump